MKRIALLLAFLLTVASGAQETESGEDSSLPVPASAASVERAYDGFWFSEGCQRIKYNVRTPYPGSAVLDFLLGGLRTRKWAPVKHVSRRFLPSPGATKSLGGWEHWENVEGGLTYVRAEQWSNTQGDLTSYIFWYSTPDHGTMEVVGRRCPAAVVNKYQCTKAQTTSMSLKEGHLEINITKVEQVENDYKVFAKLRNAGDQEILLGLNGELQDGSPELWVLSLQQQVGPDQWETVDNICPEHPAFDFIVLKPGEEIISWVIAVDASERDARPGVCRRKATLLGGEIRASIGYYMDACDLERPLDASPLNAVSPSVKLHDSGN